MLTLNSASTRLLAALTAFAAGTTLAACGDDGNKNGTPDARKFDAPVVTPDAPPDAAPVTYAATVAITDVTLVDPAATAAPPNGAGGVAGGSISISFGDQTTGGGEVISGVSNIGDCLVTKYSPAHPPLKLKDAGTFTIANEPTTETPPTGLLKTVGPCTDNPLLKQYACISDGAASGTSITATNSGAPGGQVIQYTFPAGAPLATQKLVGSYLVVNGFATDTKFNSATKAFPIINQVGNTLVVVNGNTSATDTTETTAAGSYTILNGFQPIPAAGAGGADFLGTGKIKISSAGNDVWPAVSAAFEVPGDGWTLSNAGDPSALQLTGTAAADVLFGCGTGKPSAAGNTCGHIPAAPAAGGPPLTAMIISGRATKGDLTGLKPFQMPEEDPTKDTWLEFQCGNIGSANAPLTKAALQAIIDFAPSRVEIRVINAGGTPISGHNPTQTTDSGFLLAGHALVGHTTKGP